jgi:hypothetical protein
VIRRVLALPAAAAVVLLAGCAPSPSLDFDDALGPDDAPPGLTWTPGEAELTAGDDFETLEHEWDDNGGSPAACLPFYLVQYGLTPDDEGSTDRTIEVGFLGHASIEGSIVVNAREFPSDAAATDYLQDALEAANACDGYEIGGEPVASGGIAVARFEGGHGVSLDGGTEVDGVSSRTAVVRSGRTIIVVDAFLIEADGVDLRVVDDLAATVLERLAA